MYKIICGNSIAGVTSQKSALDMFAPGANVCLQKQRQKNSIAKRYYAPPELDQFPRRLQPFVSQHVTPPRREKPVSFKFSEDKK